MLLLTTAFDCRSIMFRIMDEMSVMLRWRLVALGGDSVIFVVAGGSGGGRRGRRALSCAAADGERRRCLRCCCVWGMRVDAEGIIRLGKEKGKGKEGWRGGNGGLSWGFQRW